MQSPARPQISVVDDDEAFRKATVNLLKAGGFAAESFRSAEDFLESPRAIDTACLLLDLQMSGKSGLELQRDLQRANRPIPVIFITARGSAEAREQAIRAGAIDFLPKPFAEEALMHSLHKALTRKTNLP